MIDLIQRVLETNGIRFQRIDGQTSQSQRLEALETFETDSRCQVLLASIGSVGEGCVGSYPLPLATRHLLTVTVECKLEQA
jgi:hypothetical protein